MHPRDLTAVFLGLLALAGVAGCAATLEPAPDAQRVPGAWRAALDEFAGVRVVAAAEAWRGYPADLDLVVTPMLVTITNDGARRLEVRYEHLGLVTPGGVQFAAIPPFQITGAVAEPRPGYGAIGGVGPIGPIAGFGVAPYLSRWYPGRPVYGGAFPFHPDYYGNYHAYYAAHERVALPTGDMIVKALPEGVLEPGGRISGHVYFEAVADVSRVIFVLRLVEVGGVPFGTIEIPFIAR